MKESNIHLINAVTLIIVGLWGYASVMSPTALIPVFFGVTLLVLNLVTSKTQAFRTVLLSISFVLTLLILFALGGVRLPKSLDSGGLGLVRVVLMLITSGVSIGFFVKGFFSKKQM